MMSHALLETASRIRKLEVICYDDELLTNLCLPVSRVLANTLCKEGFSATVTQGVFCLDEPIRHSDDPISETDEPLHYWVEVGDQIIDITATQFAEFCDETIDTVTIGSYSQLPRYKAKRKNWK